MKVHSQNSDYDKKYTVEYSLKDIRGNEIGRIKLYRNEDKLKFTKTDNKGKENEVVTDVFIFKGEKKIYTITSSKKLKLGNKNNLDMNFVGMLTGVYILDLGNDGSIINSSRRTGTKNFLGKDCTEYTILTTADGGGTYYYFYQDNLMFRKSAMTSTDGSYMEALSYDTNTDVPDELFRVPADVQYIDN